MIVKVTSHCKAAVMYTYDNGNEVSVVFGDMTYSDNHDLYREKGYEYANSPGVTLESKTVEIMVWGNESFVKWFADKYEDNPGAYIPVSEIPTVLHRADARYYKKRGAK